MPSNLSCWGTVALHCPSMIHGEAMLLFSSCSRFKHFKSFKAAGNRASIEMTLLTYAQCLRERVVWSRHEGVDHSCSPNR